jgi:hypothetical protein
VNREIGARRRARARPFYAETNPEKYARNEVRSALDRGDLTRGPCEREGADCSARIEAHHDSYEPDQWLVVRWLCTRHHRAVHRERRAAA